MVVIVLFIKYQIEYENIHACNGRIGSFDFLVNPFIKENKNHENCIKFSIENQRSENDFLVYYYYMYILLFSM